MSSINDKVLLEARRKLGLYLRGIREHRKMTQRELAEAAGVTQPQVVHIESGEKNYTVDTFMAVISALDCYLFLSDRQGKHLDQDHMIKKMRDPI